MGGKSQHKTRYGSLVGRSAGRVQARLGLIRSGGICYGSVSAIPQNRFKQASVATIAPGGPSVFQNRFRYVSFTTMARCKSRQGSFQFSSPRSSMRTRKRSLPGRWMKFSRRFWVAPVFSTRAHEQRGQPI